MEKTAMEAVLFDKGFGVWGYTEVADLEEYATKEAFETYMNREYAGTWAYAEHLDGRIENQDGGIPFSILHDHDFRTYHIVWFQEEE